MSESHGENIEYEDNKLQSFPQTDEFMRVLSKENFDSRRYLDNTELVARQREIISRLPEDFVIEMAMHLRDSVEKQKLRHPGEGVNSFGIVLGELFERLVEIEDEVFKIIPDRDPTKTESVDDRRVAKKILDIMQNPEDYGLNGIELSNPDAVRIKLVDGTFEISEDVEIKTNIDARTKRQLGKNGFKQSFAKIIHKLNSTDFTSNPKLSEFGINGRSISVSPSFYQNLVILRDQSITPDGIKRDGVRGQENMTDWEVSEFIKQLRNTDEIGLIRASFGKKELVGLTHLIMGQIYKDGLS